MDSTRILIDTSIIIEYLRKKKKEKTRLYLLYQAYDELFVSSITVFEIFVGLNPKNETAIKQLFGGFVTLPFNDSIAKIASQEYQRLKSQNKVIELKDLFIGATAIGHSLSVATRNIDHFSRLSGVHIVAD